MAASSSSFNTSTLPLPYHPPRKPFKQKMAGSLKSFVSSMFGGGQSSLSTRPPVTELFPKTDLAKDGEDCMHDCESCTVRYPKGFKVDMDDVMYGEVKEWATHLLVATGKTDWVRDVADEKGSVMEAVEKAEGPTNGRLKLSASNIPTPDDGTDYNEPTTALLLPAFTTIHNIHPKNVGQAITDIVSVAPTSTTPLFAASSTTTATTLGADTPLASIPASLPAIDDGLPPLTTSRCPHNAVILMCSQRTRDARCGQSAPLLRKEFERHLRPLGLYRDLHDERPGGVGIYFISHVGGHKYSANVIVYRRPNAFGLDEMVEGVQNGETNGEQNGKTNGETNGGTNGTVKGEEPADVGAAQCIWLARVRPEDCENLIRYTVLKGKVLKPETQLRGGFDRGRGVMSW